MAALGERLARSSQQQAPSYADLLQTNHNDAFAFSEREQAALRLYDQLRDLELERSLRESTDMPDVSKLSDQEVEEQLTLLERETIQARVEYELRHRITRNVLAMDPVLKAVHGGEHTDHAEKRMLPLITENDVVSMLHETLTSKLLGLKKALSAAELENLTANERNRALSKTLLALSKGLNVQSAEDLQDQQLRDSVKAAEKEAAESRRRMHNLKGLMSAMIVGSGINWAEDGDLRELVMDDEDDD
ncbi:hypothetical protein M011DRAFT_493896 [Sporormia fimetaria CBS 119925]|uniref:Centromere protein H C-terminal domain-containing protein n=1 Tax=Sporormia fimetaria CBS 119925 TaxID=1340428 RepID=A0A6A6VFV9_9PLEO|nr:hypothetical protein M011DRAFT_493896 [Sporormia fimetaria CBS 119925]